ncbi:hypothetical protein PVL29_001510 [Vitis rotundifolia]|uniref:Pentatricopeptide repeat-containing protein n=1 Tax=Vitis rotundifolia TaxID=103349 RepID=A0AA39AM07_VITRO|nr:hypothetical protein PVL29_001510 [Vitis rotundifolia]
MSNSAECCIACNKNPMSPAPSSITSFDIRCSSTISSFNDPIRNRCHSSESSESISACVKGNDAFGLVFSTIHAYERSLPLKMATTMSCQNEELPLEFCISSMIPKQIFQMGTTGNQLHAYSIRTGLQAYTHLVPRGQFGYACCLFDQTPWMIPAVWNAIITGCAENKHTEIALNSFPKMHQLGVRHGKYAFASVLSLCSPELLDFGREVHTLVIKTRLSVRASIVNPLLTMYFNSGKVADAYEIFEEAESTVHDDITFNVTIADLAKSHLPGQNGICPLT